MDKEIKHPQLDDIAKKAADVDLAIKALNDAANEYGDGMQSLKTASEALINVVDEQNKIVSSVSDLIDVLSNLDVSTIPGDLSVLKTNSSTTMTDTANVLRQINEMPHDIQSKVDALRQGIADVISESSHNLDNKLGQVFDKQLDLNDAMADRLNGLDLAINKVDSKVETLSNAVEKGNKGIELISDTLGNVCNSLSTIEQALTKLNRKVDFVYERKLRKFPDNY